MRAKMALKVLFIMLVLMLKSTATIKKSCEYEEYVSAEAGGNITCTSSAPVLYFLQTHAAEYSDDRIPTTNWTLKCNCPDWSINSTSIVNHVWKQFTDNFYELLSESHLECGYKQFLSGLIFDLQELKPRQYRYTWWGRCTNFSEAFTTHEDFCWNGGDHILSDRENMTLEIESSRFAIRRVAVEDKQMWRDNGRLSNSWHYELCLILPVECTMPVIEHGYTDLTPSEVDIVEGAELPKKRYNESIRVYCGQGFYMVGPNVALCQGDGQWTQLPICRACKSIRYCKVLECSDGRHSHSTCVKCRHYTDEGLTIKLTHNRKKCRVVPYINRTQIAFLLLYDVGDRLLLNCPSKGVPPPTVEWSKGRVNISMYNDNSTQLRVFDNGTLELSNLTPFDKGIYTCTARNQVGRDSVYFAVLYLDQYRFYRTPDPPRILNQTIVPYLFEADQRTFLHCLTTGTPPPRIRWSRKRPGHMPTSTPVPPEGNLRINQYENGTLGFYPIRHEDWGVYSCQAINDYGYAVAQWIVFVD